MHTPQNSLARAITDLSVTQTSLSQELPFNKRQLMKSTNSPILVSGCGQPHCCPKFLFFFFTEILLSTHFQGKICSYNTKFLSPKIKILHNHECNNMSQRMCRTQLTVAVMLPLHK